MEPGSLATAAKLDRDNYLREEQQQTRLECLKMALIQYGSSCRKPSEVLGHANTFFNYVMTGATDDGTTEPVD